MHRNLYRRLYAYVKAQYAVPLTIAKFDVTHQFKYKTMNEIFRNLHDLMQENSTTTIVSRKNADGTMTVSVAYKGNTEDPAAAMIQPICLTGTPQELDECFIDEIRTPLEKSTSLQNSMADFEASVKLAQANSKAAAELKKQKDDKEKKRKDSLKKLTDDAEKAMDDRKWDEAIKSFKQALDVATEAEKGKIQAKINECQEQQGTILMFEDYDTDDLPEGDTESEIDGKYSMGFEGW